MKTIRIGKSSSNDYVIPNPTVSRMHAVITVDDDGINATLKDLGSLNGTFVNNKRITSETRVSVSDIIRFGSQVTSLGNIISQSAKTKIGHRIPNVDRKTIGKNPNSTIRFMQDDVSREHAILYKSEKGTIIIEDLGSTNGTYVNGLKITSKELQAGDKVTITRNYPLDWERIYQTDKNDHKPGTQWQRIAAFSLVVIVLIVGGVWGIPKIIHKITDGKDLTPEEIYSMYKKSVVLIYNQYTYNVTIGEYNLSDVVSDLPDNFYIDGEGELQSGIAGATGTGFFVSSDGRIATNKHVVSQMGYEDAIANYIKSYLSNLLLQAYGSQALPVVNAMKVQYVQSVSIAMNDAHLGSDKDLLPCTLLKVSDNNDLDVAVIQLNTKETPSSVTQLVDLDNMADDEHLSMGKNLYTLGFPNGLEWALTQQGVQSTNESGSVNQDVSEYLYGHNINVTHGSSGSPVFDTKGRFAGIIVSGNEFQTVSPSGEVELIPAQHNQAIKPQAAATFIKNVY